jgi:hypothetical protein
MFDELKFEIDEQSDFPLVGLALQRWFYQAKALHIPIDYDPVREMALAVYSKLYTAPAARKVTFAASNGFVNRFCIIHLIKNQWLYGERQSADVDAVEPF